jgi:metal-dependent hydrolase (beta-lactamase superfamily II)
LITDLRNGGKMTPAVFFKTMVRTVSITLLIDDTPGHPGLLTEHGLSLWIEADDRRILFDIRAKATRCSITRGRSASIPQRLDATIQALRDRSVETIIPCHCTGNAAVDTFSSRLGDCVKPNMKYFTP